MTFRREVLRARFTTKQIARVTMMFFAALIAAAALATRYQRDVAIERQLEIQRDLLIASVRARGYLNPPEHEPCVDAFEFAHMTHRELELSAYLNRAYEFSSGGP